jgi:glycerol-3-phosphate acyltransferase PlsX
LAEELIISVDAMGGDIGPAMTIAGASEAALRHPGVGFQLHGDETFIAPELAKHPALLKVATVRHTSLSVPMSAKPSQALRSGRDSSMGRALTAVAEGEAKAVVSAGNTGALMALARHILGSLGGIDRPAIAALWPTIRGETVVLDVGANVGCDEEQLVSFAVMGAAFARLVFGLERPTVGLLNIGTEEVKGNDAVKAAAQILRAIELPMRFHGFVEGDDISTGTVDVVVTDGFTGNVALKTAEGTAKLIAHYLKSALSRSLVARLGALFASGALRALRQKMDPRAVNGGVFLGLNGIVVKSHGATDALGFAAAVDLAIDMAASDLPKTIATDLARLPSRSVAADDSSSSQAVAS